MTSSRFHLVVLGIAGLLFAACESSQDAPQNLDPNSLEAAARAGKKLNVLVIMKDQADLSRAADIDAREDRVDFVYRSLAQTADETQRPLVGFLNKKRITYQSFYITNMVALFDAPATAVLEISKRPEVARIAGNPRVRMLPQLFDVKRAAPEAAADNITSTGAERVWKELNVQGEGIVVAGQDSGVDWNHPALKKQYRGWNGTKADHDYNWHDAIHTGSGNPCGIDSAAPCDDHGHGTHTMGTVAGSDGASNAIGMAPKARWIACRNMDEGVGRPSTYIECFQWFLAPWPKGGDPKKDGQPKMAPHVINNSWGCDESEGCSGNEVLPVLKSLKAAGIMVVASAGNTGSRCSSIADQPAAHSAVTFSVGATDHRNDNEIAFFSSRGPSAFDNKIGPDVVAPGENIRSAIKGGGYTTMSGTSMSGPHVVGLVALLWSADKAFVGKIAKTSKLIQKAATRKTSDETCGGIPGSRIPNNTYGYGVIDAYKTVSQRGPPLFGESFVGKE